jgi:hypothetical protein
MSNPPLKVFSLTVALGGNEQSAARLAKLVDLDGGDIEAQIRALPRSLQGDLGLTALVRRPDPATEFIDTNDMNTYAQGRACGLKPVAVCPRGFVL